MGFEIPDRFAIGYGLDIGERYRNLPYVAALHGKVIRVSNPLVTWDEPPLGTIGPLLRLITSRVSAATGRARRRI